MIQSWLGVLIRKFSSGRQLHATCGTERQLRAPLYFEELEDRAVATNLNMVPTALLVPGTGSVVVAPLTIEPVSLPGATIVYQDANGTILSGAALERLLEALQGIGTPPSVLQVNGAGASFLMLLRNANGDADGVGPNSSSPFTSSPGSNRQSPQSLSGGAPLSAQLIEIEHTTAPPLSHQSPLGGVSLAPGAGLTQHTPAPPIPQQDASRPGKDIGPPDTDPRLSASTDPGRAPQARPTALPEGPGLRGAPSGPTTTSQFPADGNRTVVQPPGPSRGTDVSIASSRQERADQPASETSGTLPASPQRGTAEIPAARTNVKRSPAGPPDGSLLQRFVTKGDQAAFTALVQRHERFVLQICQCVLGDTHAARDAFQATFLILARKAARLDGRSPVTGWLYKVAYHVALRSRARAARQRRTERGAAKRRLSEGASDLFVDLERQELRQALREELERLPEKYRLPLILCYFDGHTHAEAARMIGLPRGSIAKRIGEGLERLRERLLNRGFML
jgi:RNA polymerase sigma factor (sigma-70 family)